MNTIKKQFNDTIKREGKTITGFYNNQSYSCVFRKNPDGNNKNNHISIFYEVAAGIYQGQLLTYGSKHYLVLNQESAENSVYYKSSCVECNCFIPVPHDGKTTIPAYAPNLTSLGVTSGNVISMIDGYGKIYTEEVDLVGLTDIIGDTWTMLGWWFKVINLYALNNITTIAIEMTTKPLDNFTVELTSTTGLEVDDGSTIQLVATARNNSVIVTTGTTFTYGSSDVSIATVDSNGLITGIAAGIAIITVTWVEKSLTDTVNVTTVAIGSTYTMTLTSSNPSEELILGSSSISTVTTVLLDNGVATTFTPTWTLTYPSGYQSSFTITYPLWNKIGIKVAENYDLIGQTLGITCTDNVSGTSQIITLTITM